MKVREYVDSLFALVNENPKVLDMDVIASSDSEGNNVDIVQYTASVQKWCREDGCFDEDDGVPALCIN